MKLLFFCMLVLSATANAQTEEERVKAPILNLFEGMRQSDTALLNVAFAPGAILQTVSKKLDGEVVVKTDKVENFIKAIARPHADVYDEQITFDIIRIDADLAIAWTPYKFFVGKKFSHCGVNSFQLVRINNQWKIQYIIDTRRKENCR